MFFSQNLVFPRHQLTFGKIQGNDRSPAIHGLICDTGITTALECLMKSFRDNKLSNIARSWSNYDGGLLQGYKWWNEKTYYTCIYVLYRIVKK